MEHIAGKYKFESQENFDEFLKAQGKIHFNTSSNEAQVLKERTP